MLSVAPLADIFTSLVYQPFLPSTPDVIVISLISGSTLSYFTTSVLYSDSLSFLSCTHAVIVVNPDVSISNSAVLPGTVFSSCSFAPVNV